jgi:virginiamycin B lyase
MLISQHPRKAALSVIWLLAANAMAQSGAHIAITQFPLEATSFPTSITAGPDGALWFTEYDANAIGRISTSGGITLYPLSGLPGGLENIVSGPDNALWFSQLAIDRIGRITTAGVITEYPFPGAGGSAGVTTGPDGQLWFTEAGDNHIGRMNKDGVVTGQWRVPTPEAGPEQIAVGPDGALWFTEIEANQIGRITTSGVITEYPVPGASTLDGITGGPDGAVWFTGLDLIGRITTAGTLTQYHVPGGSLVAITSGPDGALWFTFNNKYMVGRITTTGVITQYPAGGSTAGISPGPDGNIWFTEWNKGAIGRVPACGLGFSTSFAASTLTMKFDLGIDRPATFNILLLDAGGPIGEPFSKNIPAVVPPYSFTMTWTGFPDVGEVKVQPVLSTPPGGAGLALCSEWTTVNAVP